MKKTDRVKKRLIREAIFILSICFVLILVYWAVSSYKAGLVEKAQALRDEAQMLLVQTDEAEKRNILIAESRVLYDALPEEKKMNPQLNDTPARIRIARPLIDNLRQRYRFSQMNRGFSNVENVSPGFQVTSVSVHKNAITIEYKALTDELVFSFISAVMEVLPGYSALKSFEMTRETDVTPAMLEAFRNKPQDIPFLVSGRMVFNWWTLQDPVATPPQPAPVNVPAP